MACRLAVIIRYRENRFGKPSSEALVVAELLEKFGVVFEDGGHNALECLVVFDARVLAVRIFLRVLKRLVGRYPRRDVFRYEAMHAIRVRPRDIAELVVERLDDVAQPVKLRLRHAPSPACRNRLYLPSGIGQLNLYRSLLFDAVAVHVDCFEYALGQVLFLRRRQFGNKEVQKDGELLPLGIGVREDRRKEAIGAGKRLRLPLEVHLPVLIELLFEGGDTGVKDRIKPVAAGPAEIQLHEVINLFVRVDLIAVEVRLEVVKFVRIGLPTQDRGAIIRRERFLDRVGVIHEIEHEYVVFLGMGAVEAREGLHRLDAGEGLIDVHRMQKRLVVAGLELVGADKEAVRVLSDHVRDTV